MDRVRLRRVAAARSYSACPAQQACARRQPLRKSGGDRTRERAARAAHAHGAARAPGRRSTASPPIRQVNDFPHRGMAALEKHRVRSARAAAPVPGAALLPPAAGGSPSSSAASGMLGVRSVTLRQQRSRSSSRPPASSAARRRKPTQHRIQHQRHRWRATPDAWATARTVSGIGQHADLDRADAGGGECGVDLCAYQLRPQHLASAAMRASVCAVTAVTAHSGRRAQLRKRAQVAGDTRPAARSPRRR